MELLNHAFQGFGGSQQITCCGYHLLGAVSVSLALFANWRMVSLTVVASPAS